MSALLYYITDRTAFAPDEATRRRRLLEKIQEAAIAGVDYIQLREKDLSTRDLESLARDVVRVIRETEKLRTENRERRTAIFINSRADVALAVGADGVHLRSNDISPQKVGKMWKKGDTDKCRAGVPARVLPRAPQIAVSCHSSAEVSQAAAHGATLAVFAPVFEKKGSAPAGLSALREACSGGEIPVLALGGITLSNAHSCFEAGAVGIAAIRLFQENDIAAVVKKLREAF